MFIDSFAIHQYIFWVNNDNDIVNKVTPVMCNGRPHLFRKRARVQFYVHTFGRDHRGICKERERIFIANATYSIYYGYKKIRYTIIWQTFVTNTEMLDKMGCFEMKPSHKTLIHANKIKAKSYMYEWSGLMVCIINRNLK